MSKKFFLILGGIIIVFGVLLYTNSIKKRVLPQTASVLKYSPFDAASTRFSFSPDPAYIGSDGNITSEIIIDTQENRVNSLQLEMAYDPKVLKFVSIEPIDLLFQRKILARNIDEYAGRITFGAGISAEFSIPIKGSSEEIVRVVFKPININVGQTQIKFLPETRVVAEGINGSALIGMQDLTVKLKRSVKQS